MRPIRVAMIAACATGLLALSWVPGFSFCVSNRSGVGITARVSPGDFKYSPGKPECCNYKNTDCNPSDQREATLEVWIDSADSDSHFSAILPLQAGGQATVHQEDRGPLGVNRQNLYVESWTWNSKFIARTHYGIGAKKGERDVHFLVTGDPQYYDDWGNQKNMKESDAVLREMVARIGASSCDSSHYLAGCKIRGMIVAGDLTQQGKSSELDWYRDGIKGAVRFAYDGLGNHDYETNRVKDFVLEDRRRSTVATSARAPHYSWDWHDVHFVQLNLFPGNEPSPAQPGLNPYGSLDFLRRDLQDHVGGSGRPVILIHHYGFDPFSKGNEGWWTEDQRNRYGGVIANYNVKAIFTGHNHLNPDSSNDQWHLVWKGIDTFNSAATLNGVFLDVQITEDTLRVQRWGIKPGEGARRYGDPVTVRMR